MATGLYPAHHGIVSNRFYDPHYEQFYYYKDPKAIKNEDWYFGTPLWVLAEKQQMLTACSPYWVGSKAKIQGIRPTYRPNKKKGGKTSMDERIAAVVNWLKLPAEERPHFITFYLSEVDKAGHKYGPDSEETKNAVKKVDRAIDKLTKAVNELGLKNVNYIFVSDHGMTEIKPNKAIKIPKNIKKELQSKFIIANEGAMVSLHAKERNYYEKKQNIESIYKKLNNAKKDSYDIYLKEDVPAELHYSTKDDNWSRVGDIVLLAKGKNYLKFLNKSKPPRKGQHGYDPKKVEDMNGVFYAWGPAFKNKKIPAFESVHLYPIITSILGLEYNPTYIDGNESISQEILVNDKLNVDPKPSEDLKSQSLLITSPNTMLIIDALTASVTRSLTDGKGGEVIFSIQTGSGSATVDPQTGLITPVYAGTVTLVAEAVGDDEYKSAKTYLVISIEKITPKLRLILMKNNAKMSLEQASVPVNGKLIAKVNIDDLRDDQQEEITFKIEENIDGGQATVDEQGVITAISPGTIILVAAYSGNNNFHPTNIRQEIRIKDEDKAQKIIDDQETIPPHIDSPFGLYPAYPNTYMQKADYTNIKFNIPSDGHTSLIMYNLSGEVAKELVNKHLQKGTYEIRVNLSDLTDGIYHYSLSHDNRKYYTSPKLIVNKP